jgi:arginase family enzyme
MMSSDPARTDERSLVVNPAFQCVDQDGRQSLHNPYERIRLQASGDVLRVWEHGAVPADLATQESLIRQLTQVRFLIPRAAIGTAGTGVVRRSTQPLGLSPWKATARGWALIGCAADFGATQVARPANGMAVVRRALSSRLGPAAPANTYSWALGRRVETDELAVADYGDIVYNDAVDTAEQLHAKVAFAVGQVLESGLRPLLIGGDHSLSFPAIAEVARRHPKLRVVHLDAHADRHRPVSGASTAHCGDFVAWVRQVAREVKILTIGVRGFDTHFDDRLPDLGVEYATADDAGRPDFTDRLLEFCADAPIYLTLDIDVLDPGFAPEVAYPSVGGLSHNQVAGIVGTVAGGTAMVGADFVEVCDSPSASNAAAARQSDFILTLLQRQAEVAEATS